jgi:hypothetical protein
MRRYAAMVMEGRSTLQRRRELLARHRSRVLETIAEWKLALDLIDAKIDFYGAWLATGERPEAIPSRAQSTARKVRSHSIPPSATAARRARPRS